MLDHDVPDDLSYLLQKLSHDVTLLRKALPGDSSDETVLRFAHERGCVLSTCNRDDFLHLASDQATSGHRHRHVNCDKTQVASLLLARGADVRSIGNKGMTPLQAARTTGMRQLLGSRSGHVSNLHGLKRGRER